MTLLILVLLTACSGTQPQSPIGEYLRAVEDAVHQAAPQLVPTIILDFDVMDRGFGECRLVTGRPHVYLHIGAIVRGGRTPEERSRLLGEVLIHELGHAALSCTERDHQVLP